IHSVRTMPSPALREAIDQAIKGETSSLEQKVTASESADGQGRWLQIRCQRLGSGNGQDGTASVSVIAVDVTDSQGGLSRAQAERDTEREERTRVTGQVDRLADSNRQLLSDNDELTS